MLGRGWNLELGKIFQAIPFLKIENSVWETKILHEFVWFILRRKNEAVFKGSDIFYFHFLIIYFCVSLN